MKLPDLSESMYVARLRYIQSVHESPECRGPDVLVRYFIPAMPRWRAAWLSRAQLDRLRAEPFYYYLLARTIYYDRVVQDAVADGVKRIVIVGCGSDTRPYRFQLLLRSERVNVLECDQPQAIRVKQQMAVRWRPGEYVEYLPIDLNDDSWPELERWMGARTGPRALVLMEGVSVYVDASAFSRFLGFLATHLSSGSQVAYDFKILGSNDEFGRVGRTRTPFRLSRERNDIADFHDALGLRLEHMELSAELNRRLLPGLAQPPASLFSEDGLLRLLVS
jgi:methyltransferase (TIGR00027 family)